MCSGSSGSRRRSGVSVPRQQPAVCHAVRRRSRQPGTTQHPQKCNVKKKVSSNFTDALTPPLPPPFLLVLLCLIRVSCSSPSTWPPCGSCRAFSSVRTTNMAWGRQWSERLPALTTTREETTSRDWEWDTHTHTKLLYILCGSWAAAAACLVSVCCS